MRGRRTITQNLDWPLIIMFFVLALMGWVNIYAATYSEEHQSIFDFSQRYGKQLMWIGAAVVLGWILLMIDGSFFSTFAFLFYGVVILMLVGVLFFGTEIKGARSWFTLGPVSLQPSEFAKFATALALSKLLSGYANKKLEFKVRWKAFAIILLPAALIVLQPDAGSALVFGAFIFVLYREGLSGNVLLLGLIAIILFITALLMKPIEADWFGLIVSGKVILILVLTAIAGLVIWLLKKYKRAWVVVSIVLLLCIVYIQSVDYLFDNVLSQRHRDRINDMLGITFDPQGVGYNVHQSKIAIGSGGFSGKGFLQGTQTKFDFVPEQSTDFIFCTIGEEWGFLGSSVVVLLFIMFIIRLVIIAERQRSQFSRIYGYCVACIIFFHFMVNVGMTIGLAPVIGIPLPFFSYGGSSLWAFTILLFIFIKMDSERKHIL